MSRMEFRHFSNKWVTSYYSISINIAKEKVWKCKFSLPLSGQVVTMQSTSAHFIRGSPLA